MTKASYRFWACAMTDPDRPGQYDIAPVHELTDAQLRDVVVAADEELKRRAFARTSTCGAIELTHNRICLLESGHAGDHHWQDAKALRETP